MYLTLAVSIACIGLLSPLGTTLPAALATTSTFPKIAQTSASNANPEISQIAARGAGEGGVRCSASAAARNSASSRW